MVRLARQLRLSDIAGPACFSMANVLNPYSTTRKMRRRTIGHRRGGRVVECTGLENQQGFVALRGFESHPLRHKSKRSPLGAYLLLRPSVVEDENPVRAEQQRSCNRRRVAPIPPAPAKPEVSTRRRRRRVNPTGTATKFMPGRVVPLPLWSTNVRFHQKRSFEHS
jgi:hypothetical protein